MKKILIVHEDIIPTRRITFTLPFLLSMLKSSRYNLPVYLSIFANNLGDFEICFIYFVCFY